ncbi:MAG: GNAT family N-acetyltransferase [Pirellulaceae bacterium]|nr:GNAT family N-acetyltransferase [Pirellulaceae bacterium]
MTPEHFRLWDRFQQANSDLANPHFRPELFQAVSRVLPSLEVVVVRESEEICGFFPFSRGDNDRGTPFAQHMSDMEGMISATPLAIAPLDLLTAAELASWEFHHVPTTQPIFADHHHVTGECPYMDLSDGFEAYRRRQREAGHSELQNALRKSRKIERELGPLRFVPQSTDLAVLDQLLDWKSQQLQFLKLPNGLIKPWVRPLFEDLLSVDTPCFAGMLSSLYVGDSLAAVSLGLRSDSVLHGWVTSYNVELQKYSPGLLLLIEMAKHCETAGLRRIDMGQGPESYKQSFRSGGVELAAGVVDARRVRAAMSRGISAAKKFVKSTSWGESAKSILDRYRVAQQSSD